MRVNIKDAMYITVCVAQLDAGRKLGSDWCPECDDVMTILDSDNHIVHVAEDGTVTVIIACEGYHVINPASVGIDSPGWMDALDPGDNGVMGDD